MSEKKQLNEEELEKINGGYNFTFYEDTFTENTKVKTLVEKYPWVLTLYPALETAVKFNLTIATACSFGNITYEQLQAVLTDYQSKYDANGNPIVDQQV